MYMYIYIYIYIYIYTHTHKENKIGLLINDTYTDQYNPLFELVTSVEEGEEGGVDN
jgi:hypothetical protein